ncbi:MAG: MarR family transcriptional regulator [Erysipelotrichaceae bacterium]|nr:MarR family transcriptional regulator [Erysipelotrichaceae bacterium]
MNTRFEDFAGNVLELNRCIQKIKDLEMKQYGLRASHVMCMHYLGKNEEGLTSAQLTSLCKEDKAAVSRTVSQLLKYGLVRYENNVKGYRSRLLLSDQGKELNHRMNQRVDAILALGGTGLSEEEKELYFRCMNTILSNLKEYLRKNSMEE